MPLIKKSFQLTIVSNIIMLFLSEEKNRCGNRSYGFPTDAIHSFCSCPEHALPIDFSALAINLVYHFVIWFSMLYLLQDAKETWATIFGPKNLSRKN
jgi:hypothetical protein